MNTTLKNHAESAAAALAATPGCGCAARSGRPYEMPGYDPIVGALERLLGVLFPVMRRSRCHDGAGETPAEAIAGVAETLADQAARAFAHHNCEKDPCAGCGDCAERAEKAVASLIDALPAIRATLGEDALAAYEGDPAATSVAEVVMSYPGFFAIAVHRIAHCLYKSGVPIIPRVMSEYAHSKAGIDIHPGASIGPGFFIDHGTGVVIGETCTIGRHVKLYQGVTLGARSFPKNADGSLVKGLKRHPDVEDDVVIYAGATVLGGETVIGRGAVIGASVWITSSVPPGERVLK
ncbi:MAG: serine acetyltransferase [Kiritimatiellae bacterium]|nr:serine acetyltransferase [Kiritimatiellia bacterium]